MRLVIDGKLPGLNEYTNACRSAKGWQSGYRMKKKAEEQVIGAILSQLKGVKFTDSVYITFTWIEPNKNRDLDNVCFAKKFILDALVKCGVLTDDNRKHVTGFRDYFEIDKDNPRIEVEIGGVYEQD